MLKNIIFLLIFIFLVPACYRDNNKLIIINVLDKDEYQDCSIKGSINIPFEDLEHEAIKLDKNAEIVVYCSNYECLASKYSVEMLKALGFKHVYAYEAGMAEWYQQGLPVKGECRKPYLKEKNIKNLNMDEAEDTISTEDLIEKLRKNLLLN